MQQMLNGVRFIELTQNVAGPYCTQILGDLGVEAHFGQPIMSSSNASHDAGRRRGASRKTCSPLLRRSK